MTPREKHLREALAQAKHKFNEIQCLLDSLTDQGMEDAEKAKQEADKIKDGPSEEDKEYLEMGERWCNDSDNGTRFVKTDEFVLIIRTLISKLKKCMGIE